MSNEMISVPRGTVEFVAKALAIFTGHDSGPNLRHQYGENWWVPIDAARNELRALLAKPAEQPQGEPTAEMEEAGCQAYMAADGLIGIMHKSSMGHAYRAMRALEQHAPAAVVLPERLAQILKFLEGAENLDGYWFGDPGPTGSRLWWRSELRKALTETSLFENQQ